MTDIRSLGVLASLAIVVVYGLKILIANIIQGSQSLRDSEKLHRFLLIIGGILVGLGLGGQEAIPDFAEDNLIEILLGILFIVMGLGAIVFASVYLRMVVWRPLEEIAEYSFDFGTKNIATRLPRVGGKELIRFVDRFNSSSLILANKVSDIEIKLEMIYRYIQEIEENSKIFSDELPAITSFSSSFSDLIENFEGVSEALVSVASNFIDSSDTKQESLDIHLSDLRSLADTSNLLSINAAIEEANLDEKIPGFITLTEKLHELAKSLEMKQEHIWSIIGTMRTDYRIFSDALNKDISQIVDYKEKGSHSFENIEQLSNNLIELDKSISKNISELKLKLIELRDDIPNAF